MDIKSQKERSLNMSKIRANDTKPELYIRSLLHRCGYRFRVNYKSVVGHPDIYFTKKRVAIFVHGCYWHRHPNCKLVYMPKSNIDFWKNKFENNVNRDKIVMKTLKEQGVRIALVWECSIKKMINDTAIREDYLAKIQAFIESKELQFIEI